MKKIFALFALCLLLAAFAAQAQAAPLGVHWSTDVKFDQKVMTYNITIPEDGIVYIFTNNSKMDVGLYLWDAAGKRVSSNENYNSTSIEHWEHGSTGKTTSQMAVKDAMIAIFLKAGEYQVSVTPTMGNFDATDQGWRNLATLIAQRDASPNTNLNGNASTLNVVYQASPVPIPASALLLAPGLAAVGVLRRKLS